MTVSRKVTLAFTSSGWLYRLRAAAVTSEKLLRSGTLRKPREEGTSAVGGRCQATANENLGDFKGAVATLIFRVCYYEARA
jgi:hypothetical protein